MALLLPAPHRKLYDLIGAEPNWLVEWAGHGESFFIRNEEEFCAQVLPKYFRHTKLTSFQRQLNLYGFRRITLSHRRIGRRDANIEGSTASRDSSNCRNVSWPRC